MQIHLHIDWPAEAPPAGYARAADSEERRSFSGRLELLAVLEELALPDPLPPQRS